MTPDTLALARAIGEMPGAPTFNADFYGYTRPSNPPGPLGYRTRDGIGWVQDPEDLARYVLDLEDAGTGGVLLAHIGPGWLLYQRDHDRQWEVSRPDGADKQEGPTLGIAVARLIIARGGF